jgi:hypothetical protein
MKRVSLGDYGKRVRCYVIRSSTEGIATESETDANEDEEYLDYDEPLPFDMP